MRVLLIYCHPVEDSYNAALHRAARAGLERAGHAVDVRIAMLLTPGYLGED